MKIHSRIESSTVNGPENRAVIWFQGCTLNCKGCWNPDTHSFTGSDISLDSITAWLDTLDVQGITFSGGEPLQHYNDLVSIIEYIRKAKPNWSIGMFSGYSLAEAKQGKFTNGSKAKWYYLAEMLDFAVMGRYNQRLATSAKPLCGSSNQDLVLFSQRYTQADFESQAIEVTIGNDLVQVTGFPSVNFLMEVRQ